ncbi:hypothetical protein [Deinococcus sp. PESE-13]
MKTPSALLSLAAVGLLASCAPAVTGPQLGRIVSGSTGEEGTVSIVRGTLRPIVADPFAPDNVTIEIGGQTYKGRTQIVGRPATALPAGWGLSVGVGGSTRPGDSGQAALGWDTRLDSPRPAEVSYSGNLIARTNGARVRTLTCTLTVDARERGFGECTGENGTKYALQF